MKRIMVIDDEANMCKVLGMILRKDGYEVVTDTNGRKALSRLQDGESFDLIISDMRLPDLGGMELLDYVRTSGMRVPFVLITAYGTIQNAVDAMKRGATDFITKPFNKDAVRHVVQRLFRSENPETELGIGTDEGGDRSLLVCNSRRMQLVLQKLRKLTAVPRPVLISGESGSGKELAAKKLHTLTFGKHSSPFVSINCPAVPESLFESELFGYQKGAFTGAEHSFKGKLRSANGGTLFLDEIGELPLTVQAKFLRFLDEHSFVPLGSTSPVHVNARIICATNRNLQRMVEAGEFRGDLFYRINTIELEVPPLRERREDIEELVQLFLEKFSKEIGQEKKMVSTQALNALRSYHWPGNVRELRNVIERAVLMCNADILTIDDFPPEIGRFYQHYQGAQPNDQISDAERSILLKVLEKHEWNVTAAAREVGISRSAIRYRIQKYQLYPA
ncbi:MAG: sigma-54 dependent transcriptional regulator [Spirochaetota bacterium]|nr:sigma-54 dependent transcriptional regulator [Spirochaetota bacterium]